MISVNLIGTLAHDQNWILGRPQQLYKSGALESSVADSTANCPSNYELKSDLHPLPSEYSLADTDTETKIDLGSIEKTVDVSFVEPSTSATRAEASIEVVTKEPPNKEKQIELEIEPKEELLDISKEETGGDTTSVIRNASVSEEEIKNECQGYIADLVEQRVLSESAEVIENSIATKETLELKTEDEVERITSKSTLDVSMP